MKCTNIDCEKINYCEKIHELNDCKLNDDETIFIPNEFYHDLNYSNRFVKRGVPSSGFIFGCYKLIDSDNGCYSLFINDIQIANFKFSELMDCCNEAFREMIENGDIKIQS